MQKINFLKDLPTQTTKFNSTQFFMAILLVIAFCIFYSCYLMFAQYLEHKNLEEIKIARENAARNFQQVAKTYPLLAATVPLEKKVEGLANELLQGKKAFEAISHTTLRKGFSEYMLELSKVSPSGLWIVNIEIDQDVKKVSIQGKALQATSVAILIEALNDSKVFQGMHFDLFNLERKPGAKTLSFEIANEELKSKQAELGAESGKVIASNTNTSKQRG